MCLAPRRSGLHDQAGALLGRACGRGLEEAHEEFEGGGELGGAEVCFAEAGVERVDYNWVFLWGVGGGGGGWVDAGAKLDDGVELEEFGDVVSVECVSVWVGKACGQG